MNIDKNCIDLKINPIKCGKYKLSKDDIKLLENYETNGNIPFDLLIKTLTYILNKS